MANSILVIDDDEETQRGLKVMLSADGFHVSSATDAISAMIAVRRMSPDLVILDLGLRAGDGFSVLHQLRAHKPFDPIPAIVLTARHAEGNRQRALDAGAVAFLQKPADHDELLATIRAHIGKSQRGVRKVLIVEDDPDTQKGIAALLQAEGFVTNFASDAATAVSVAAREKPDIILLDLGLPAGDGFKVMERLAIHPTLNDVPFVVISARDPGVNRPKALQAGAVAYFQKPADFDELLKVIRAAVGDA
jgi:DNA-binding response OmpR family regulator